MPTYDISGVKSTGSPITPQRQQGAEAFGAGLARGLQDAGNVMTQRALQLKAEEDEARAREMDTEFSRRMLEVLHDPESGYFTQKGRTAMDGFKPTQETIDKLRREIAARAGNDTQRQLFERSATARQTAGLESMSRHAARETTTWKNQVDEAAAIQARDMAVANRNDPKIVSQNINAGRYAQAMILDRQGVTGEAKQVALEAWETETHKAIIDGMLKDDNPQAAKAYYERNMERIDGTSRPGIEQAIDTSRRETVTQQAADGYMLSGMTEAQALADARKKFSGKDEDEVVSRIKTRFAEQRQVKNQVELDAFDEAQKIMAAGKAKADIPKEIWDALDGKSRLAINSLEASRLDPAKQKTDPKAHIELYDLLDQGVIRSQAQIDKYRPFLSPADYEAASKELRQRGSAKEKDLKSAYLKFSGKTKMEDSDLEDYVAFTDYARSQIAQTKQSDPDDIENLAARWKMEGYTDRTFGPDTFGEAYREGELHNFIFETPDDVRGEVQTVRQLLGERSDTAGLDAFYTSKYRPAIEELRRRGKLVTPETIALAIKYMTEE